jgi:hypothetical protein
LRWVYDAGVPMSAPAVMGDGTVVVGLSRTTEQLLAIRQDGTKAWAVTVGTGFVTAPPTVGADAIWVGSNDFWLRGAALDGTGSLTGVGVNLEGAVRGGVSVSTTSEKEWSFAASISGRLGATSAVAGEFAKTTAVSSYESGTAVTKSGWVCAVSSGVSSTLRCFEFDGALAQVGAANVGVNVLAPLAIDSEDHIWSGSQDGKLNRSRFSSTASETTTVASLPAPLVDSPVIASGGDVLVGDADGVLHRFDSLGNPLWSSPPNLGGAVSAPLLLMGGSSAIVVSTRNGTIHALRADGSEVWRGALGAGAELRSGNIFTDEAQTTSSVLSTALFASADGKLYAVVVDGQLDTAAPWPKAFHDPRNTNNAGTAP